MLVIYHNPRCRKSREGLKYLEEQGIDHKVRDYFREPFTEDELDDLLKKLGKEPHEMIRTQEVEYKKHLRGKNLSRKEWIRIMVETPKLIQRPVVVKKNTAVLAQPVNNIMKLL